MLLIAELGLNAQEICGFDVIHKAQLQNNEGYRRSVDEVNRFIAEQSYRPRTEQVSSALFTIPVVVHVIHTGDAIGTTYNPTDATIQSAIDYLNQVYNGTYPGTMGAGDLQIQFALARLDPNCNPTNGIVRVDGSGNAAYLSNGVNVQSTGGITDLTLKNMSRWDATKYYNIWLVSEIDNLDGTSGMFLSGYAYFPGASPSLDGTVMLASQMRPGRRTLPHEIGHAFSLYHPFEGASGSTCPGNADCNVNGDRVCDTDPVTQPPGTCRTGTNPCTNTAYNDNTERNYMSYVGTCSSLFTEGQKARILTAAVGPTRLALTESAALVTTFPVNPYTAPAAATCTPATSSTGLSNNFAGIMSLNLAGKTIRSNTARIDNGYMNNSTDCHDLIILQPGLAQTVNVTLLGANAERLRGWIDYNNNGSFDNTTEEIIHFNESTAPGGRSSVTASASFVVPAGAVTGTVLRMRLLEDISVAPAISTACQNPVYGQAEDYAVYITAAVTLPVQLLRLDGIITPEGTRLSWETSREENALKFIVQRSGDGIQFSDVGEVSAAGNSITRNAYSFLDRKVLSAATYYRLKMTDKDGQYRFSNIIRLKPVAQGGDFRIINNPVVAYLELQVPSKAGRTTLRIVDLSGKVLGSRIIAPGQQQVRLTEVSRLSPGIYFLEIQSEQGKQALRFVRL